MILTALLFASLHLPSAFLDPGHDLRAVLFRFAQTGLSGFILGYIYWRTKSVPTTIALHGLWNFGASLALHLSGLPTSPFPPDQMLFHLLWLGGEGMLTALICQALFPQKRTATGCPPSVRQERGEQGQWV